MHQSICFTSGVLAIMLFNKIRKFLCRLIQAANRYSSRKLAQLSVNRRVKSI